jgi:uncharacterized protein (TIGR02270 family)
MKNPGRPPCLLDIVEEHFEELDCLWEQREGVIFAPDWTLAELAALEERAEAHLDGLRLAELHAVDLARPALAGEETFAATAATFVLMETGVPQFAAEVIEALANAETPELRDGIRIGLRHSRLADRERARLGELAGSSVIELAIAASDLLAFQRIDTARLSVDGMQAERPIDRVLALGVSGRRREPIDEAVLRRALADPEASVRMAALRAAAASGSPTLAPLCRGLAAGGACSGEALAMLGVLGDPLDLPLLIDATGDAVRAAASVAALGALGRAEAVPHMLALLDDAALARPAASAFTRLTGEAIGDLAAGGDTQTDEEDEAEPRPDADHAKSVWARIRDRFSPEARWQAGVRVDVWGPFVDDLPLAARRDLHLSHAARVGAGHSAPELEARARRQAV